VIPQDRYSPRAAAQLLDYLIEELRTTISNRRVMEEEWRFFQRQYMGEPEYKDKTFPFPNASNIVVQLAGDDVDTIHARLMAMLYGPESLWSVQALRPDMEDFAPRLQEFLKWAQNNELDTYIPVNDWLLEICKLGTGILKTRYVREQRKIYEFREMGPGQVFEQQVRAMLKDSPKLEHVSLFDFYLPSEYQEIEGSPWCGERITPTWAQLVNRQNAGIYMGVDKLRNYRGHFLGSEQTMFMEQLQGFTTSRGSRFEIFEMWPSWDIDEDGEQEALVCTIHPASRSYLRIDFNPFFNQLPPYDAAVYQRVEKRFYGIGPVHMVSDYQQEVTTLHNQRIDSGSVKNANVIVALKTSNITQDEPIFPGRILLVDNVEEVKVMSLGTTTDYSSVADEQLTLTHAARRVGVTDWISGADSAGVNYASATVGVQQLREGSKRFDQVLRNVRYALRGAGTKVAELYQQFSQGQKIFHVMGDKEGGMVQQLLSFPTELIRLGVMIDVTATTASYNKEVEARTQSLIMQQLVQFYMQLMQAIQVAVNPAVPPPLRMVAYQGAVAGTIMMRKMIDTHGIQDADRLVPNIQEIFGAQQPIAQPAFGPTDPFAAAGGGGNPLAQGPPTQPGLPALGAGPAGMASGSNGSYSQGAGRF
jgi:hypothetical protein